MDQKSGPITDRLKGAKDQWDEMVGGLPTAVALQNNVQASPDVLSDWFAFALRAVQVVENGQPDPGMMAIHWPSVSNAVQQVGSHMDSAKQNGIQWLAQTTQTLVSQLWTVRSSLSWLLPASFGEANAQYPHVKEILARAGDILSTSQQVARDSDLTTRMLRQAEAANEQIVDTVEKINGYERSAANAQTTAAASAATAEAERQRVDQHVAELESALEKQQSLFDAFEEYKKVIEGTIQGASKVALAKSFQTRREALAKNQKNWQWVFCVGILVLLISGFVIAHEQLAAGTASAAVLPAVSTAASSATAAQAPSARTDFSVLVGILLRFVVVSPVIWLTWFAARQYGHCLRLGEDYAFKEAAAHAFVGYRSEMGDDPEMIKLLREYAIKNFGANPTRVLAKNEPVTPLNDVIEHALEKVSPDKVLEILKDALSSAKK
ncbi:hypothetical protein [Paraburkholderia strydomiana]|uniref:hypothetical protein n=1 Tax=Paraburkholderia strydomiana TaxID=1245417 RepID=UPI0038BBED57